MRRFAPQFFENVPGRTTTPSSLDTIRTSATFPSAKVAEEEKSILSPEQIIEMQSDIAQIVKTNIAKAGMVLAGTDTWTANQIKLFGQMINKVVPDLHHSFIERPSGRKLTDYSLEELEALAFSKADEANPNADAPALVFQAKQVAKNLKKNV
jgi:hypothetical protein